MSAPRSILLATDFRPSSQQAARAAVSLSKTFSAPVTIFHVLEEVPTWPVTPQENQDRLLKHLAAQDVDVTDLLIGWGPPADTIVRKARELAPDLLLIGTGEKRQVDRLVLGPVTTTILEQAPPPVLAVHPDGPKLAFATILCPVDFSEASRRALEDAIRLARAFAGRLVVLTVVPKVTYLGAALETAQLVGPQQRHDADWVADFQRFLDAAPFGETPWEREVRRGVPHEQIAAAARDVGADLLVLGATGRTGLARLLLGSVTRRVLGDLPCSVLVVKSEALFDEQLDADLDAIDRLTADGRRRLAEGRAGEAAGLFRQALTLDPYHEPALEGMAQASEQLGQADAAGRCRARLDRLRRRGGPAPGTPEA